MGAAFAFPVAHDGFAHAEACEAGEIDLVAFEFHDGRAGGVDRRLAEQLFGEIDQAAIVRVGLVKLQHGELGVVVGGEAFVAEVAVDLVDAVEAAHHQALQVELGRDAQVEIDIEGVVVGDEGTRGGAAIERLHHGRLDFDELAGFQLAAEGRNDARARHEDLADVGVRDQVEISLAISRLHVFEAVPFLRHGEQSLAEELQLFGVNAEFAGARAEQVAFDTEDVADIEKLEESEIVLADGVFLDVDLEALAVLLHVRETRPCPCDGASSGVRRCAPAPPAQALRRAWRCTPRGWRARCG